MKELGYSYVWLIGYASFHQGVLLILGGWVP